MKTGDWRKLVDDIKAQLFGSLKERDILEDKLAACEKSLHDQILEDEERIRAQKARAEKAEATVQKLRDALQHVKAHAHYAPETGALIDAALEEDK
jgi:DNA-binding GntR family transcriptional regulator